jgi:hypothetical protein
MRTKPAIAFTLVCLVAVIVVGYLYLWRDNDEQIIVRNLNRIVELAEKTGDESPFLILSQSQAIVKHMASDPEIHFGPPLPVLRDRNELTAAIAQVRQGLQTLNIRIVNRTIVFAEDRESAEMEVEAEANVSYSGESGRDRRLFAVDWIKEDGEWLIQRVRLLEGGALPPHDLPF